MSTPGSLDAHYRWATAYLRALIQAPPGPPPGTRPEVVRLRAQRRLERLRSFLDYLGNPHRTYPVVHVTGTSGKGSTAALVASLLHAHGYRVGLHISPYLQVELEKLQIGQELIAPEAFARYVAELDDAVRRWIARGGQPLTYGEFWTALVFYGLQHEAVDIAVIEVGVGGRFDLTNVVEPEVAIITTVGLDHLRTLGPTIHDIAWHKAGIIKPGRPALTGVTDPELLAIIRAEAEKVNATLTVIQEGVDYEPIIERGRALYLDRSTGRAYVLGLPGSFQVANAALAVAAVRQLGHLPLGPLDDDTIARGLALTRFPGRFEIVQETPQVILDGAHNPQKLEALLTALSSLPRAERLIVVYGVLDGHDAHQMAQMLAPLADYAITTAPRAVMREAADPHALARIFQNQGTAAEALPTVEEAIDRALALASPDDRILVTGSLYLVGQAREHWYPSWAIITQRTCWPRVSATIATFGKTCCSEGQGAL